MIKLFEQVKGLEEEFRGAKQELIIQLRNTLDNREIIFVEKQSEFDNEMKVEINRIIRFARSRINDLTRVDTFLDNEEMRCGEIIIENQTMDYFKEIMNYIHIIDKLLKDEEESE